MCSWCSGWGLLTPLCIGNIQAGCGAVDGDLKKAKVIDCVKVGVSCVCLGECDVV